MAFGVISETMNWFSKLFLFFFFGSSFFFSFCFAKHLWQHKKDSYGPYS